MKTLCIIIIISIVGIIAIILAFLFLSRKGKVILINRRRRILNKRIKKMQQISTTKAKEPKSADEQQYTAEQLNGKIESKKVEHHQNHQMENIDNLLRELCRLFEEEKIYRQHRLNTNDICLALDTNRTYLANVLKSKLSMSFNDFVNSYRINEAKEILENDEYNPYTADAIGELVGFSSKSTFYSTFKQMVGITPVEYKKLIKKKNDLDWIHPPAD